MQADPQTQTQTAKPRQLSPEEEKAQEAARILYKMIELKMLYLYDRWQDEHEYADINDYSKPLAAELEKAGASNIHLLKHPFGFRCTIGGFNYQFSINATKYSLRRAQ